MKDLRKNNPPSSISTITFERVNPLAQENEAHSPILAFACLGVQQGFDSDKENTRKMGNFAVWVDLKGY